jgi:UDP-glucose 4-epimerase
LNKILVTGASGFIGTHLCKRLLRDGREVHGVSRTRKSTPKDPVRWWTADCTNYFAVRTLLMNLRPDIVFHLAGRVTGVRELTEVIPIFQGSFLTTVNVLTSATEAGCKRVVMAGSSEEPFRSNRVIPSSPYAAAKWSSSAYAAMFRELFHAPVIVPRVFITYGPGKQNERKVIPYTILSVLGGQRPKLSSGMRMVDWIFIDDVIEGLVKAAFTPNLEEGTFDLGSGSLTSVRKVAEEICDIIGNGIEPDFGSVPDRPMEQENVADLRAVERIFHWKPSKSIRDGLEETIDWYRSESSHLRAAR